MNARDDTPWFRYQFTNSSGREFDTLGIDEKYDAEKKILEINKGDGTTSVESNIYKFEKTPI
jgi:hypothetical protein